MPRTTGQLVLDFNTTHQTQIIHDTVAERIDKFKTTCRLEDQDLSLPE